MQLNSFVRALVFVFGAVVVTPSFAQNSEVKCTYTRKVDCGPAGCTDGEIGSAYLMLPNVSSLVSATISADRRSALPTIRRCDSQGCTAVVVRAESSGAFVNIVADSTSYFIKILATDLGRLGEPLKHGDFVEVASTFLATITYFGSCAPAVNQD